LAGNTDIEDSVQRLDKLTQEEARMASAELLKVTHGVDGKVEDVHGKVQDIGSVVKHIDSYAGNQLRDGLLRWLSPSDPSINHNLASKAHHNGTAEWFFQGNIFNQWKSTGSFLWIHGKRVSLLSLTVRRPDP
jgi:hypothetical protein